MFSPRKRRWNHWRRARARHGAQLALERLENRTLLDTGALDTTFGIGGKVLTSFPGAVSAEGAAVAVQPDGKIVVAGTSTATATGSDFAVARYLPDGSLDPTFDGDGRLTTDFGGNDEAHALVLQPDGKIIVAGGGFNESYFALARYLPDGRLDPSFHGDGKLLTEFFLSYPPRGYSATAFALVLQPDGKILAAGDARGITRFDNHYALARYLPDGSRDPSFGSGGILVVIAGGQTATATGLALQSDGKILMACAIFPSVFSVRLLRLLPNGQADTSFDGDGTVGIEGSPNSNPAVVSQPDGKVVVAYTRSFEDTGEDFALGRFLSDGRLDPSFDGDGLLTTNFSGKSSDRIAALSMLPDGRLVAAGSSNGDFAMAHYLPDGRPDPAINSVGRYTADFGSSDAARGIALQADGKLIAAGISAAIGSRQFAVARFLTTFRAGRLQFSPAAFTASEAARVVTVTVIRTDGSDGTTTVRYVTVDGTARAGIDYMATSGTLSYAAGETTKTFTVAILNDDMVKRDRVLTVRLSDPTDGASLGDPTEATVTILEDDLPVVPDSPRPANLSQVALDIVKSREQYQDLVRRAYRRYLKRIPDDAGLLGWSNQLLAGTIREEQLEASMLASRGYIQRYSSLFQPWVIAVYQDVLGRTPAEAEVNAWVDVLWAGRSQYDVAYTFTTSVERASQRVQANYRILLGREPSPSEVAAYVNLLVRGVATTQDVLATFVSSQEYYASPQRGRGNKAVWVVTVYEQVLFRPPQRSEVEAWLSILQ